MEEQFIVIILDKHLSTEENALFENLLNKIGEKNAIPNFFSKIGFDEANRRLVAFTKHLEETPPRDLSSNDHIARSVNISILLRGFLCMCMESVHYYIVYRQFIKMESQLRNVHCVIALVCFCKAGGFRGSNEAAQFYNSVEVF